MTKKPANITDDVRTLQALIVRAQEEKRDDSEAMLSIAEVAKRCGVSYNILKVHKNGYGANEGIVSMFIMIFTAWLQNETYTVEPRFVWKAKQPKQRTGSTGADSSHPVTAVQTQVNGAIQRLVGSTAAADALEQLETEFDQDIDRCIVQLSVGARLLTSRLRDRMLTFDAKERSVNIRRLSLALAELGLTIEQFMEVDPVHSIDVYQNALASVRDDDDAS